MDPNPARPGPRTALERRPLSTLTPYPGNARRGDVSAIADSLTAHGQYRPLVVQASTGYVLAGSHTLAAMRSLGWEAADVVAVEVGDEAARRIVLADNRTADLATYDTAALADLLADVTTDDLAGTGFTAQAAADLVAALDEEPSGMDPYDLFSHAPGRRPPRPPRAPRAAPVPEASAADAPAPVRPSDDGAPVPLRMVPPDPDPGPGSAPAPHRPPRVPVRPAAERSPDPRPYTVGLAFADRADRDEFTRLLEVVRHRARTGDTGQAALRSARVLVAVLDAGDVPGVELSVGRLLAMT